jgi:hypothetical protein
VIEDITNLPHYREFICNQCGHKQRAYSLVVQTHCENCKTTLKLRGYAAIGSEVEDVIDAVLAWLGQGDELELAMQRKRIVDMDS